MGAMVGFIVGLWAMLGLLAVACRLVLWGIWVLLVMLVWACRLALAILPLVLAVTAVGTIAAWRLLAWLTPLVIAAAWQLSILALAGAGAILVGLVWMLDQVPAIRPSVRGALRRTGLDGNVRLAVAPRLTVASLPTPDRARTSAAPSPRGPATAKMDRVRGQHRFRVARRMSHGGDAQA